MELNRNQLQQAVSRSLSEELGRRLALTSSGASIHEDDLGCLLIEAMFADQVEAKEADLFAVEIYTAEDVVRLEPSKALQHPLLAGWVPLTLSEAIAQPILASLSRAHLAIGVPEFVLVSLVAFDGELGGCAILKFEGASATLYFGREGASAPFSVQCSLSGRALEEVGAALRGGAAEAPTSFLMASIHATLGVTGGGHG